MANKVSAADIRAAFEGVYAMQSWHDGGKVETAPAADGRWVVGAGQIVSLLLKHAPDKSGQTIALFGHYVIEDGAFSYGYDGGQYFLQKAGGTGEPAPVPFGEMRRFEASREGDVLRLRMAGDVSEFRITGDLVEYLESGQLMRRWKRVSGR